LAALVKAEFFTKRATEALRKTPGQLALDQHRVDRPADIALFAT
jgi:hypothetical protein